MRYLLSIWLFLSGLAQGHAQFVCFSDSTSIYEFPGADLPPMFGETRIDDGHFQIVIGGKFIGSDSIGVYNCDMLLLDLAAKRTYVLPLSYFPPFVDDQFAGIDHCFTVDKDTAYILGGYGVDLAEGFETTFPTLTYFPVKTLIEYVTAHKDYLSLFKVLEHDPRLAIAGGKLVHVGPYFLVYNGRRVSYVREEFSECLLRNEWDWDGQLRKFAVREKDGYLQVDEFQICNTSRVFYQCMPDQWGKKPDRSTELQQE